MDCEKVRDRFSALWERELAPFEEKRLKEHLSSCPECQREFEQFEKTMRWLHSVGDMEVPDEFLPGLYKKMEERKRTPPAEKPGERWFNFPLPLKLPVQAVAMVAVIFLVLYLTKMMPLVGGRPKEAGQPLSSRPGTSASRSSQRPFDAAHRPELTEGLPAGSAEPLRPSGKPRPSARGVEGSPQKEVERERRVLETSPGVPRPKDVERTGAAVPREEKSDGTYIPQMQYPSEKKSAMAPIAPQEIVLKISDRGKAVSQLRDLVKKFKGEIVTTEGNGFVASLPAGSFSEFEKELVGVSSAGQREKVITRKGTAGGVGGLQEVEKEAVGRKIRVPAKLAADEESRIVVRILLVQE
jgi:hypothetical protein